VSRSLELAERAAHAAQADAAEAVVRRERSGFARFAASRLHQPTLVEATSVHIRVVRDGRVGSASTGLVDDAALSEAARRAEAAANSAPVDPGFPGFAPPASVPEVGGYDEETAELPPDEQAAHAWSAIEGGGALGLYGYFTSGEVEVAVAATTGNAVAHSATDASLVVLAADATRSGWASACSWLASQLDPGAVAAEAVEIALRTGEAGELPAGSYRAVLAPEALAHLLQAFAWSSLSARSFLDGRSYLSGRLGEELFHPGFTLLDDAGDPRGLPKAVDFEGVPRQAVTIVDRGVAREVVWDRRTAAVAANGRSSTGHAPPPAEQEFGPMPASLIVLPGSASREGLLEAVDDGIYVTRVHYLSVASDREGILTGMTRDGTFRIRGGKLAEPLVNLRFTTSFPEVVRDLLGVGCDTRLIGTSDFYDERFATASLVPAIATGCFDVVGTGSGPGL
jgi:predicted Zn-dependent protease